MNGTAIVTDSTADIPGELLEKYNIHLVPLSVIFGNQSFREDGKEITAAQFYQKLQESRALPKSAQPSPGDFFETYSRLFKTYDNVISIHISKKMSGTIDSAVMAKKKIADKNIEIIDSELVHMPLGFLVLNAAQMAQQGKSVDQIVEGTNNLKSKMHSLFIPNTLEYLQKGGRIGRARSLIASVLEIKPILTLKFGEVSQFKTTRRWRQAKNELVKSMAAMVDDPGRLIVSVADSDTWSEGEEMKQKIEETFHPKQIIRVSFGCVLGTHLGPGALGITFYED
ncbi:MAG: DegV family protein [Actinomycetia bacterium]|nr:DegV family protein [Actinomycetes bacterium]